jgi:hypothetical protein
MSSTSAGNAAGRSAALAFAGRRSETGCSLGSLDGRDLSRLERRSHAAELVGGLRSRPPVLQRVPTYAAVGAFVGVAQWLVLRRQLPRAWQWVPVTAAAWAMSSWLIDHFESRMDEVRLAISVGAIGHDIIEFAKLKKSPEYYE